MDKVLIVALPVGLGKRAAEVGLVSVRTYSLNCDVLSLNIVVTTRKRSKAQNA